MNKNMKMMGPNVITVLWICKEWIKDNICLNNVKSQSVANNVWGEFTSDKLLIIS